MGLFKKKETIFFASFKEGDQTICRLQYFAQEKTKKEFMQWLNDSLKELNSVRQSIYDDRNYHILECKMI